MPTSKAKEKPAEKPVELNIEKMSGDGSGIARTASGVVFVEGALPGETVDAVILKRKKDFALARTVRVKTPNLRRVVPPCPVFGVCGGCQLQHAACDLQLEIKADIVHDALKRIGGFDLPKIVCTPSPEQWGYRNKASFPIRKIKGRLTAGFYRAGSHRLVQLESCPVNAAPLNALFRAAQRELATLPIDAYDEREHKGTLRHLILRAGESTGEGEGETLVSLVVNGRLNARRMKTLAGFCRPSKEMSQNLTTLTLNHNSRPGNVITGSRTETLRGDGLIAGRLDEWTLRYDTTSFFQINTAQAVRLYRYVRELAVGKNALELYSGIGSLTCYLSRIETVTAVEEWEPAVELMKRNLEENGISSVRPVLGKAEEVTAGLPGGYDLVVMDPPRGGCDRGVLEGIAAFAPQRVIYVSCNPSTLARDARILADKGYVLRSARAFDMFPQTVHVETVALLEKM